VPLNLEDKKRIVREVNEVARSSVSMVIADYRGLTVDQMTQLRIKARHCGVYLRVVPNKLTKRALEGTGFSCFHEAQLLVGPLILAFSEKELNAAARLIKDFCQEHEALAVKGLSLDGQLFQPDELNAVAKLPTREEALSSLLSVMKAPVSQFVRVLNAVPTKLVRTLVAVSEKNKQ